MKQKKRLMRPALAYLLVLFAGACASAQPQPSAVVPLAREDVQLEPPGNGLAEIMERARMAVPVRPDLAQPSTTAGTRVWRNAVLGRGLRVLVSTEARSLWLMRDTLVVFRAPVAVGMEEGFVYKGKRYDFTTPISQRRVLAKDSTPIWVPPDWHYFEIAVERGLEAVQLRNGQRVALADGTRLEVRARDVGRVNQFDNFYAFESGMEIVFDGKVFIPPFGTRQRQIPDVLGTHKLDLGDGYLIHGTNQETSIGDAVSHGCIRMYNDDVAYLFSQVPVGTPVFIF
ncbi:hypothetical protein BH23GEM9_BH23GEM9_15490 [soil metagenome]